MTIEMYGCWGACYSGKDGRLTLCSPRDHLEMERGKILEYCRPDRHFPNQRGIPCKVAVEVPKELEACVARNIRTEYGSFLNPDDGGSDDNLNDHKEKMNELYKAFVLKVLGNIEINIPMVRAKIDEQDFQYVASWAQAFNGWFDEIGNAYKMLTGADPCTTNTDDVYAVIGSRACWAGAVSLFVATDMRNREYDEAKRNLDEVREMCAKFRHLIWTYVSEGKVDWEED